MKAAAALVMRQLVEYGLSCDSLDGPSFMAPASVCIWLCIVIIAQVLYYASTYGVIHKFVNSSSGTWSQASGWPRPPGDLAYTVPSGTYAGTSVTPYGLRSITGYRRTSDNHLMLVMTTYHSSSCTLSTSSSLQYCGVILQYDATAMGVGATLISETPSSTYYYMGVAMAPFAPTPSSTPSNTASVSSTQTPSNTPTATGSMSFGSSPSETNTGTPSSSQTGTNSPTPTATRSNTATRSATNSPTGSPSTYPRYGGRPFTEGNIVGEWDAFGSKSLQAIAVI